MAGQPPVSSRRRRVGVVRTDVAARMRKAVVLGTLVLASKSRATEFLLSSLSARRVDADGGGRRRVVVSRASERASRRVRPASLQQQRRRTEDVELALDAVDGRLDDGVAGDLLDGRVRVELVGGGHGWG